MAEPADFYSDIASINVTPNGVTLIFLRTLPIPLRGRVQATAKLADGPLSDDEVAAIESGETVNVEIAARVRMGHKFALDLRDLIDRTLSEWQPTVHEPDASGSESPGTVESDSEGSPTSAS